MDETGNGKASSERRQRRRWPVVVAAVAVVLVAAGAGFWVWHEQPSFCNAVCHEPMDAYVEGYYGDAKRRAPAAFSVMRPRSTSRSTRRRCGLPATSTPTKRGI